MCMNSIYPEYGYKERCTTAVTEGGSRLPRANRPVIFPRIRERKEDSLIMKKKWRTNGM